MGIFFFFAPEVETPASNTCSHNTTQWVAFCFGVVLIVQNFHTPMFFLSIHCSFSMEKVILSSLEDGSILTSTAHPVDLPNNILLYHNCHNG